MVVVGVGVVVVGIGVVVMGVIVMLVCKDVGAVFSLMLG